MHFSYFIFIFTFKFFKIINAAPFSEVNYLVKYSKILHFTDFHYDKDYDVNGTVKNKCHKTQNKSETLGTFGNYNCDSPEKLVSNSIENAKNFIPDPELILWTGDSVPHIDNYTENYVINALNVTTKLLKKTFSNTLVLPTFGNHDSSPSGFFPEKQTKFYKIFFDLWEPWIGSKFKNEFLKGGYYSYTLKNGQEFLCLNTILYYIYNPGMQFNSEDPANQFKFMISRLEKARKEKRKVHIIGHVAPGLSEFHILNWFKLKYNKKFLKIVIEFAETIGWMVFGHHHTDTFHLVKNKDNEPAQLLLLSPSVTPWYSVFSNAPNNPAFRVFYRNNNWDLYDIVTYYVDLNKLNQNSLTKWKIEYSMRNEYNLNGPINAKTFALLSENLRKNDSLFKKYFSYNTVLTRKKAPKNYSFERNIHLCSLEWADYDQYIKCVINGINL